MAKFEKKSKDISEKLVKKANSQSEINVVDFKLNGKKPSSIIYSMPIYRVINDLKIDGKIKGIHEYVNTAIAEKLRVEFPAECKKFWSKEA